MFNKIQSLAADLSFGTIIGLINDWPVLLANFLLIGGRVLVEILIMKREARKKAKRDSDSLEP